MISYICTIQGGDRYRPASKRYHHMQEVANTQSNWLKLKDNTTVELSEYTIDSLLAELSGAELELA